MIFLSPFELFFYLLSVTQLNLQIDTFKEPRKLREKVAIDDNGKLTKQWTAKNTVKFIHRKQNFDWAMRVN